MSLFTTGDFRLSSGAASRWKIECDALTGEDIATLAMLIRQMVGPFGSVDGVPSGGLRLQNALRPFVASAGPALVVDDVLTTGGSITRFRHQLGQDRQVSILEYDQRFVGAVVFARGPLLPWCRALFTLPHELWLQPEAP